MRKLPDQFVLSIKDQIRSARYRVRRNASADDRAGESLHFDFPQPMAFVADAVLSQVEAAAGALLAVERQDVARGRFPLSVTTYFGHPDEEAARGPTFTRAFYNNLKILLKKLGATQYLVFEQSIDEARSALLLRHADLIWSVIGKKRTAPCAQEVSTVRLCAAIACELTSHRPIKELHLDPLGRSGPKHLLAAPNAYCALTLGLATAIVSVASDKGAGDGAAVMASADLAVDARFARFSAALRDRDPVNALAKQFLAVLPFLP
jgi:hypothetical protein